MRHTVAEVVDAHATDLLWLADGIGSRLPTLSTLSFDESRPMAQLVQERMASRATLCRQLSALERDDGLALRSTGGWRPTDVAALAARLDELSDAAAATHADRQAELQERYDVERADRLHRAVVDHVRECQLPGQHAKSVNARHCHRAKLIDSVYLGDKDAVAAELDRLLDDGTLHLEGCDIREMGWRSARPQGS